MSSGTQSNAGCKAFTAGETVKPYRRAKLNSSGEAIYADADDDAIGTFKHGASSGEPVTVELFAATRLMVAAGAFALYADLYQGDDGQVDDDQSTGRHVGIALTAGTQAGDRVEVLPTSGPSLFPRLVYSNIADSAEVENTTTPTSFDLSKTIDGATLKVGDVLRIKARAYVVDNNSTDTLTLKLFVGSEEIVTTGAVDVADGDIGYIEVDLIVRAAGAGGSLAGGGLVALGVPGTVTAKPFRKDAAAEDLSGDVAITVQATWSVAHADNEVELEQLTVEHIPR